MLTKNQLAFSATANFSRKTMWGRFNNGVDNLIACGHDPILRTFLVNHVFKVLRHGGGGDSGYKYSRQPHNIN